MLFGITCLALIFLPAASSILIYCRKHVCVWIKENIVIILFIESLLISNLLKGCSSIVLTGQSPSPVSS